VRVEAVGVEHERHVGRAHDLPREGQRAVGAPDPGAQDERARRAARARWTTSSAPAATCAPPSSGSGAVITSVSLTSKMSFNDAGTHAVT